MVRLMKSVSRILVCSVCALLLAGCNVTLGPRTEIRTIIVRSGVPIEVLDQVTVNARVLTDTDGTTDVFKQDVGGWIMMHPDHWETLSRKFKEYKKKAGE